MRDLAAHSLTLDSLVRPARAAAENGEANENGDSRFTVLFHLNFSQAAIGRAGAVEQNRASASSAAAESRSGLVVNIFSIE